MERSAFQKRLLLGLLGLIIEGSDSAARKLS